MKYWQKTFIFTLILFLAAFDIGVFCLADETFKNAVEGEKSVAISEQNVISGAIGKDIEAIKNREGETDGAVEALCASYLSYYEDQGIFIRVKNGDTVIADNIPVTEGVLEQSGKKTVALVNETGGKYILVGGYNAEASGYYIVCCRDITKTVEAQNNLNVFLIIMSIVISAALAAALFFLMKKLSHPISELTKASKSIADGHYSERVAVVGIDEIAELASNFNHMAERIEAQIAELKESGRQKQEFIDNLAHELRTPLTSIYGYAEYIQNAKLSEDDKIMATDYIMSESNRLKEMAYKLLDLALLREGNIESLPVDIELLADSAVKSVENFAAEKGVEVQTDLKPIEITGDIHLLQSIVVNFMNNAVNACRSGGRVVLRTYDDGRYVIEVEDNGVGMTVQEARSCLEPFYRADKARSRENGGNGLGLALCDSIAKSHGAAIEIDSEKGSGTKMKLVFKKKQNGGI